MLSAYRSNPALDSSTLKGENEPPVRCGLPISTKMSSFEHAVAVRASRLRALINNLYIYMLPALGEFWDASSIEIDTYVRVLESAVGGALFEG